MDKDKPKKPKSSGPNTDRKNEGNIYDKILRENLPKIFLPIIAEVLDCKITKVQALVDKQPTTVIRETDGFLLVETDSATEPKFILHLEFESGDDPEMIYRMSEHHGIELRKYRLPIKHIVVYLGQKPPRMRTKLNAEEVFTEFTLVNVQTLSPEDWLSKEEPEKIIMAVLGNYQEEEAISILQAILSRLRQVCKSKTDLKKFIQQLIILSRMRNLEELTINISKEMPIHIDVEKDYLYKLGWQKASEQLAEMEAKVRAKLAHERKRAKEARAKAREAVKAAEAKAKIKAFQAKRASISNMLKAHISLEQMADFLGISIQEVKAHIAEIKQAGC